MTESRLEKLNTALQTYELDAVILNPGPTPHKHDPTDEQSLPLVFPQEDRHA